MTQKNKVKQLFKFLIQSRKDLLVFGILYMICEFVSFYPKNVNIDI